MSALFWAGAIIIIGANVSTIDKSSRLIYRAHSVSETVFAARRRVMFSIYALQCPVAELFASQFL